MDILKYCGHLYENTQELECRHDARLLLIHDADNKDFHEIKNLLEDQRYDCYAVRQEGEVLFATYVLDEEILNLSYTPFEKTIRIIQDIGTALPPNGQESAAEERRFPASGIASLVTQVHQRYWEYDCGMTYLIRLGDGRFAVIDGGMAEAEETEHLLALLREQNVL